MTFSNVRSFLREFVCDIVIFLYKIGEALLDASVRPYTVKAVCSDIYDDGYTSGNHDDGHAFSFWEDHRLDGWKKYADYVLPDNTSVSICAHLDQLPQIQTDVQRHAAGIVVAHRILVNIPAVILGLFCGAWSDIRGRKVPMMAPSAGSCLAVVLYLASTQVEHFKVFLLLTGAAIQGIFGKTSVIAMAVNSHVSDTSDREQRTRRLGRVLASSFLGMFMGSLLAGLLQDVSSLFTTLAVVSACHALCVFTIVCGVTETVSPDHVDEEKLIISGSTVKNYSDEYHGKGKPGKDEEEEEDDDGDDDDDEEEETEEEGNEKEGMITKEEKKKNKKKKKKKSSGLFSLSGLKKSLGTVCKKREGNKRSIIIISLLALTLNQCLKVGDQDITVLFVQEPPLSWPSSWYGYLIATDYGTMGMTLIFLLPLLADTLHMSDVSIAMLAIVFKLIRALWAGFCTKTWMVFTSAVSGALGGLVNPGLRSMLSKTANSDEVGKLFSIQASLETLSKLVGSTVFTGIYAATVNVLPAAAYLSEAVVYILVLVLLVWLAQLVQEDGVLGLLWTFPKPYRLLSKDGKQSPDLPSIHTEDVDQAMERKPIFPLGASTP